MEDKEQAREEAFGKYVLISELRNKYAGIFDEEASKSALSGMLYLEGIHFNLVYFPLRHLAYKAVVNSIADLYCRNILPQSILVNIGVSARFKKDDIDSLIEGLSLACSRYSLKISSLDISSSLTGLAISIASTGKKVDGFRHAEPRETDLVCLSGDLGAAFLGLQLLERERRIFEDSGGAKPKLEGFEYVIGRQLKPDLKISVLDEMREAGLSAGVIRTVRDGLASELIHISRESGLGCRIYHDRLPVDGETAAAGRELGFEPLMAALNGGDDFEFVITVPVEEHEKIQKIDSLNVIGHLVPSGEGNNLVLQDGSLAELKAQGWEGDR